MSLVNEIGFEFEPIIVPDGWQMTGFEAIVFLDEDEGAKRCIATVRRGDMTPDQEFFFGGVTTLDDGNDSFFGRLDLEVDWN